MTEATRPLVTFRSSVATKASPERIYEVLADLRTHAVWAGEQAPRKTFRLLSIDAPAGMATVGDRFTSTGANFNGTFHDRSTVVEAEPGVRFGFDTDATLDRKHGKPLHVRFESRYVIEPAADGAVVKYTTRMYPQNYVPYWFKRGMRGMSRRMAESMTRKNMEGLAAMAEAGVGAVRQLEA